MRLLWIAIGWTALALATIGLFIPVMPTVPFLLVSIWAFTGVSDRLRRRILRNKHFGPLIRDWMRRGAIPVAGKIWSVLGMAAGVGWSVYFGLPIWALVAQTAICVAVAVFIVSRPS